MAAIARGLSITHICPACRSTHHIPVGRISTGSHCEACREPWSLAEPIAVDEASFTAIVRQARLPIVMAFCDNRSGPCRRIAPDLYELAGELAGRAVFLKVDTDQQPQLG